MLSNKGKSIAALSAVIIATLAATGCGGDKSSSAAESRNTLVIARTSEPEWLNPVAGHQHPDADLALFRGLFRLAEGGKLVPDMASDYSVSEDGLIYTIKLKPGVHWHDGHAFAADDVKFTLDTILDPKNHSGLRTQLGDISKVEIVDDLTVRVVLSKPFSSLPAKLQVGLIPKHVLEGKDFNTDAFSQETPIGTGPFKFESRQRGEYLMYSANPDFYGQKPGIDRLIYKIVPDPNVRLVQLIRGELDVTRLQPKDVAAVKNNPDISVQTLDSTDFRAMMFNFNYAPFRDLKVRRAIQYATDRQALVDGALLGYGVAAYGPLQMLPVSAPDLPKFDNDVDKAKALLAEAGWKPGADGIVAKDGERLSFALIAYSNDQTRQDLATLLSAQLRRAGIEANVQFKDVKAVEIDQATAFILGGGSADDPDTNLYRYFSSHLGDEGTNWAHYQNEKVDRLLDQARNTLDPEQRDKLYREIQQELIMDPPFDYLVYLKHIYGVRKELSGFKPRLAGHGTTPLWNIEEWSRAGDAKARAVPVNTDKPSDEGAKPEGHHEDDHHEEGHDADHVHEEM